MLFRRLAGWSPSPPFVPGGLLEIESLRAAIPLQYPGAKMIEIEQIARKPMRQRTYNLMVADDDASVRESLCKLLHGEGYQVVAVSNGAETIESFGRGQNPIDLLLVDLNMPLKNGWAALDRSLEINPSLPIIIVTGQPNQYEMAEAAGVSALVEKPIDVPSLLELIHKLLSGPAPSRIQGCGNQMLPFHFVRAAGCVSDYWKEQHGDPYHHGGLNE